MISHYRTSAPCTTRRKASPTPRSGGARHCATNWSCFTRPHAGQGVGAVDRPAGYDFIRTGLAFETHGAASGVWLEHLGFGSMRGLCIDAPCCDLDALAGAGRRSRRAGSCTGSRRALGEKNDDGPVGASRCHKHGRRSRYPPCPVRIRRAVFQGHSEEGLGRDRVSNIFPSIRKSFRYRFRPYSLLSKRQY